MGEFINFLGNNLADFWTYTGFANATVGHIVMILIGLFFIYLAVAKEFEPMLSSISPMATLYTLPLILYLYSFIILSFYW